MRPSSTGVNMAFRSVRCIVKNWLRSSEPRPCILMYHRIAELSLDPWGLAVSPKNFEQQLSFLKQTRQVMRCSEFFKAHEKGTLPANAVAITFDDGYADNLEKGWPLLKRAGLPATLFLTTGIL